MLGMLCWRSSLVITSALVPSYLPDHLRVTFGQMSEVMSAIGFGSMAGTLTLPWLSDRMDRKLVMGPVRGGCRARAAVSAVALRRISCRALCRTVRRALLQQRSGYPDGGSVPSPCRRR